MESTIKLSKGQIEDFISDSTQTALNSISSSITLDDVTTNGATTINTINVGKLGINNTAPETAIHMVQDNAVGLSNMFMDRYFTSGGAVIAGRAAGGTKALPTAIGTARALTSLQGWGYNGSAFTLSGRFQFQSTEPWTVLANGTEWGLRAIKTGTLSSMIFGIKGNGSYVTSSNLTQVAYDALPTQTASFNILGDATIPDLLDLKNESQVSRLKVGRDGIVTLSISPTVSVGTYEFITRNTSTGILEKVSSSIFVSDSITDGITTIAPSQNAVFDALALKQNSLVSGTNIKTIGGQSILGSGNLTEVQNSLTASSILAPSVDAVNTGLALKASNILTGYVSGAGTVAATDTVLQAIQKLNGNIVALGTSYIDVTGTSATMVKGNKYKANNAALVTLTLPVAGALGDQFFVRGYGVGKWKLQMPTGVVLHGNTDTAAGGYISAQARYDTVAVEVIAVSGANITEVTIIGNRGTLNYDSI